MSDEDSDLEKTHEEGLKYFKDEVRWSMWLDTQNNYFNNQTPRSVIWTESGRHLIRRTLRKLENGFTA